MSEPAAAIPGANDPIGARRTFAIIAHPDAGKTTLTEKLLLFGGAIHLAGAVKARGESRRARSDWLKIEQQRGISVSTSVMNFEYQGWTFNLLDTPGHEDFSEDTYRTLTAVDSAVMVLDAAKGIETQTRKLFEVTRLRDMPIITFVNKMDRESQDPFALLDEVASTLALDCVPANWPIGMGHDFRGCYDLFSGRLLITGKENRNLEPEVIILEKGLDDPRAAELLPEVQLAKLREDIELIQVGYPEFDAEAYRQGHMTPVYFGTALKNFGVDELLKGLGHFAPPPQPQPAEGRMVIPTEKPVTGFVFKVQANMDKNHRDRVAFLRLCSGHFKRGMKLKQVRSGKPITVSNPTLFFARDRALADEAWPGDIIGIPNHGTLRVGDTLTEAEELRFTGIPNFAPEILRRVRLSDPMKAKHLQRALEDLAEEGVTQVFRPRIGSDWVVGLVGPLQLDVLAARLAEEYGLEVGFEQAPYETARWVSGETDRDLDDFVAQNRGTIADDRDGAPVFMARNAWELSYIEKKWDKIRFHATRERS
ncbi:peptide chain release factor 3 [Ferrovibrio sp.]|uniref:peptide chain release factor 3 n=1 Tax=Ferrovibrio sp. TaxID=1917215 RepID=UPI0035158C7A